MMPDRDRPTPPGRYPVPAGTNRSEQVIDRSRFIATVGRAGTVDDARAFIDAVRTEFPDATHNCWAYVIGPPGDTRTIGMSDAGEPSGTAGRPMLDVLLGSGVGDVVAVVTRYYGGVKLGRGGLVRAYGGSVKLVLESLRRTERVPSTELLIETGYQAVTPLKGLIESLEGAILGEEYGAAVALTVRVPNEHVERLLEAIAGLTDGTASVEIRGPAGEDKAGAKGSRA
jgi:uncharacterized YigZ family protein